MTGAEFTTHEWCSPAESLQGKCFALVCALVAFWEAYKKLGLVLCGFANLIDSGMLFIKGYVWLAFGHYITNSACHAALPVMKVAIKLANSNRSSLQILLNKWISTPDVWVQIINVHICTCILSLITNLDSTF